MKKLHSLTALLLAGLLTFGSCSQPAAEEGEETAATENKAVAAESVEAAEEDPTPFSQLPEKNYDGKTFNLLARADLMDEQWVEGINGEALNDAVYERNSIVEDRYNITFAAEPINGGWDSRDSHLITVRKSIQAGDGAYDLVEGYAACIGDGFVDNLYYNLNTVPGLQLDRDWWSALIREELTINGKLFAVTGDISISLWEAMQVLYFNKEMLVSYNRENPYDLVLEGKWTIDKYLEMIEGVALDLDGNGVMDANDLYGALYYDDLAFDNLHNAFGVRLTTHDAEGNIELNLFNDMTVYLVELGTNMAYNNPDILYVTDTNDLKIERFTENRALFFANTLNQARVMRDMTADFGILPIPKYNEEQENYYTTSRDNRAMYAIPTDVKDIEFAGTITEALCVAGNQEVIPIYYDTVLKSKAARDEESGKMLDILRSGIVLDFAEEYAIQTARIGFIIRDCIYYQKDIASEYKSSEKVGKKAFAKFLRPYTEE